MTKGEYELIKKKFSQYSFKMLYNEFHSAYWNEYILICDDGKVKKFVVYKNGKVKER